MATVKQLHISRAPQQKVKTYLYGVTRQGETLVPFVCRKDRGMSFDGALATYEVTGTAAEAHDLAEALARGCPPTGDEVLAEPMKPAPWAEHDVVPGAVCTFTDTSAHHTIVLRILPSGCECDALMFTSNPAWARLARRATTDELALAGYAMKNVTYLALVRRSLSLFDATGAVFPQHRLDALKKEFLR